MNQVVFIHGPGGAGCAESSVQSQTLSGQPRTDVAWTSGGKNPVLTWNDIRKEGGYGPRVNGQTSCSWFHLGACIALEYGLDYPDGVKALVLMTVAMRPKERPRSALELWLNAAQDAGSTGNGSNSVGSRGRACHSVQS